MAVLTGLDVLIREDFQRLRGKRLALLTNPSAVDRGYRHILDVMLAAGLDVRVILAPEHGLYSVEQDMIAVGEEKHRRRVVSLYGDTFDSLRPSPDDLQNIDMIVFDIQDVGSRYYTYVWTLALVMEVAAPLGIPITVLDRPNPLGGLAAGVEGGGIEPALRSFVGWFELPNRHGLTAGEIALWVAGLLKPTAAVRVVWMEGWRRDMLFGETGAPWVLPSPNMPTPDTALVYPGQCLLEGTNLSEGRGTTRPFEIFGAPWLDGRALAAALEKHGDAGLLPGVAFRPLQFRPTFQKHAGAVCGGVQLHVMDARSFRPVATSYAIVLETRRLHPGEFRWRREKYEFRDDVPAFDLLSGHGAIREAIDELVSLKELLALVERTGVRARKNRAAAVYYPE